MDRFQSHALNGPSQWVSGTDAVASPAEMLANSAIDDAHDLIRKMGAEAQISVAAGATAQFGAWLGWPAWLTAGTSLESESGFPDRITLAHDLILLANIVDHGKSAEILARLTEDFKIPGAPITVPALYNAPTLAHALEFFERTAAFASPFLKVDIQHERDQFCISVGSEMRRGALRNFCASAMLSIAYRFVSFFVIDDAERIEIYLEAERAAPISRPFSTLPGTIQYQAGIHALHGKLAWLQLENLRTDTAFWNFALERMTVAEREGKKSEIVRRIRNAVCHSMETEARVPRLKQIAACEQVSERTLVRALAVEGVKFHQIVEEERRLKAAELIGNSDKSLTEIAKMLGFTDMSSFGRSYRQWFGVTPGQARTRRGV